MRSKVHGISGLLNYNIFFLKQVDLGGPHSPTKGEFVLLQVKDVKIKIKNEIEKSSILPRKNKTDQDLKGKWLRLSLSTHLALVEWMKERLDKHKM